MSKERCSIPDCDWQGPFERHRRNPEVGYTKENVVIYCPNHHEEVERSYLDPEARFELTEYGKEVVLYLRERGEI